MLSPSKDKSPKALPAGSQELMASEALMRLKSIYSIYLKWPMSLQSKRATECFQTNWAKAVSELLNSDQQGPTTLAISQPTFNRWSERHLPAGGTLFEVLFALDFLWAFAYGQENLLSNFNTSAKEFIHSQTMWKVNIHKTSLQRQQRVFKCVWVESLLFSSGTNKAPPHPLAPSSSPFKSLFNVLLFTANHFSPLLMMLTLEPAANWLVSCQPLSIAHFC